MNARLSRRPRASLFRMNDAEEIYDRMLDASVRNRLFYWLEDASTAEAQIQHQRELSFAWVPGDLIFETDTWDFTEPDVRESLEATCSREEIEALEPLQEVAWEAWEAIREDRPSVEAVQSVPEWIRLRELAKSIQKVFAVRGPNAEAEEYWRNFKGPPVQ